MFAKFDNNRFFHCVGIVLGLLFAFSFFSFGEINIPPLPTKDKKKDEKDQPHAPIAVPVTAQVVNGGIVQVMLRVYGRQEQTTNYLIRKEPSLGKIIDLQAIEPEVWLLTYKHGANMMGLARMQDHILFAAQNKNGTSSAAEIVITILDNPPKLSAPASAEFGEIASGISTSRMITISNTGGGMLEGNVTVEAPWSIEPANYRLERGEQAQLRITLLPESPREYLGHLHFSSDEKIETLLHAKAFQSFSMDRDSLELPINPNGSARSGTFALTNKTDSKLVIEVDANPRLHLPKQIPLKPKATESLAATLSEDDKAGVEGMIRFSIGANTQQMRVHSPSLLNPTPTPLVLVRPTPAAPTASPSPEETPSPTPEPQIAATPPPMQASPNPTPRPRPASSIAPAIIRPEYDLPLINGFTVVQVDAKGAAEFAWEAFSSPDNTFGNDFSYRLEARRLAMNEKNDIVETWIPIPDARLSTSGNRVTGVVTGIPPGTRATTHVVALTPQNAIFAQSPPVAFMIPVKASVFSWRNALLIFFSLLTATGLVLKWIKKSRNT